MQQSGYTIMFVFSLPILCFCMIHSHQAYNISYNLSCHTSNVSSNIYDDNFSLPTIEPTATTLSPTPQIINDSHGIGSLPQPNKYILSFPTEDNPLTIKIVQPYSLNYFLIIGDWGASSDVPITFKWNKMKDVQIAIANKMLNLYHKQKSQGKNLLAIISLGDNFYFKGQNCQYWQRRWKDVYKELTNYPWLSVFGNHDFGNNDYGAICGWINPKYIHPNTSIGYNANQLNTDKGGCNPSNYYIPDFGYYYTINELSFELIVLDTNIVNCPCGIGGGGYDKVMKHCGGENVMCSSLSQIHQASYFMMIDRADTSNNTNFLISQHYHSWVPRKLLKDFKIRRNNSDRISCIYGHKHEQRCEQFVDGNVADNICELILTGGGGGCCGFDPENWLRGFYVIGFDDDKNMIQPMSMNDNRISCKWNDCLSIWQQQVFGYIIGGAVAGVVLIIFIVLGIYFCIRHCKRKKKLMDTGQSQTNTSEITTVSTQPKYSKVNEQDTDMDEGGETET
eukprot:492070_1